MIKGIEDTETLGGITITQYEFTATNGNKVYSSEPEHTQEEIDEFDIQLQ